MAFGAMVALARRVREGRQLVGARLSRLPRSVKWIVDRGEVPATPGAAGGDAGRGFAPDELEGAGRDDDRDTGGPAAPSQACREVVRDAALLGAPLGSRWAITSRNGRRAGSA